MEPVHRRTRLEAAEEPDFSPWVKASTVEDCHVFWLHVPSFPMRDQERSWLVRFLSAFSLILKEQKNLREELFLQFATASTTFADSFQRYAQRVQILPGLSRRNNEPLQGKPDAELVKQEVERTSTFDLAKWTPDYAIWFQGKRAEEQRELFFGGGGMTLLFLPPDPQTVPPPLPFTPRFRAAVPVFQRVDMDAMVAGAFALNDRFLPESKRIFGKGLETSMNLDSVGFVLPLFESRHLVEVLPEERSRWFELFDVYCREAPADSGILLVFQKDYRACLLEVLHQLDEEGLSYPLTDTYA